MKNEPTRREFLKRSGTAAMAAGLSACAAPFVSRATFAGPGGTDPVPMALIGCGGRGQRLMRMGAQAEVFQPVAVCDVQQSGMDEAAKWVKDKTGLEPKKINDFRKLMEEKDVQAVLIATPDHWHAIQTITACMAEKDVYVEKPISHNIAEGLAMVAAVRKNKRVCQVGLMQRTMKDFQDAVKFIQSGKIGKVGLVKAWFIKQREDLGNPPDGDPPAGLDWDLWLGPAPKVPFNPVRFKVDLPGNPAYGSWRWFWDYAGGQLLDWGPHMLDVVRWGLGKGMPRSASASGGKYVFTDARECPDTLAVVYDYGDATAIWEHRQWSDRSIEPNRYHGIEFFGDHGTVLVDRSGWEVYPEPGSNIAEKGNPGDPGVDKIGPTDKDHVTNFAECVKSRKDPIMPIEEGFMTTATCQLGNVSFRSGTKVVWDGEKQTIADNPAAMKYFGREYRKGFELPKV